MFPGATSFGWHLCWGGLTPSSTGYYNMFDANTTASQSACPVQLVPAGNECRYPVPNTGVEVCGASESARADSSIVTWEACPLYFCVDYWCDFPTGINLEKYCTDVYGQPELWDTSQITSMRLEECS